ncbi:MAG TPA: NAD(P)H-hydrate dehydratase [Actinophytocola sp.]|uniref:NAD(P)H-hydrate dehydratase n=1 Tax=Actinophytocola sp. TaxID=1872138 RepID=UPI002DBB76E8|nr:NAD(P)H-hydrate dehydratase [Actinophytocola sp.]HEU5472160.1 NAD(P)H-hydrate dehydratase [Actinophytocola sp.]
MRGVWTTEHVKAAEERLMARVPAGTLMRRAAFGVAARAAAVLAERTGGVAGRRVTLLVGAGNNGGDALWAGHFLRRRSVAVDALLLEPDRAHAQGLAALRRAGGRIVSTVDGRTDLVVDGIVGLSAHGPLRAPAAELVAGITAPVLAVDLPSGVDPDTGAAEGPAVTAAVTVTFGCRKPVHVLGEGLVRSGAVHLVDIGLAGELGAPDLVVLDPDDVAATWPLPGPRDDKYTQGVTGIAAGSATYPGAAVLTTGAAVLATSGMVRYAGSAADEVRARWPEVVATGSVADAGRVQAWVAGPGLGTGTAGREVLGKVLGDGLPVCVDADGITLLATNPELWDARDPAVPVVLTPHDREFARIADPVRVTLGPDRVAAARALAAKTNCVVLLKGYSTVVADPAGRVLVNPAHSAWLATAGSGDVLSGLIGALLAAGIDPWLAAGCAAWVHERAGALAAAGAPAPASKIVAAVPDAIRSARGLV